MRAARAGGLCAALAAAAIGLAATPCLAESRRVEVDPRTGRIVEPTDQQAPAPDAEQSTSHEGLVEHPGTTRAGGVGARLRGRFRSHTRVTHGIDGRLVEDCEPAAAAAP